MPRLNPCGLILSFQVALGRKLNKKFQKRMKKSEIFAGILADVSKETEIDSDRILSPERTEEVVDARYLVISMLSHNGFYPRMIAERIGMSQCAVRKAMARFDERLGLSPGLRLVNERIAKKWRY